MESPTTNTPPPTRDDEAMLKWAKALESGDYPQARSALKTAAGGYCCVGVLYDVNGAKWEATEDTDLGGTGLRESIDSGYSTIGPKLGDKLGLFQDDFQVFVTKAELGGLGLGDEYFDRQEEPIRDDYNFSIYELNDSVKLTFPEIAKVIRFVFELPEE